MKIDITNNLHKYYDSVKVDKVDLSIVGAGLVAGALGCSIPITAAVTGGCLAARKIHQLFYQKEIPKIFLDEPASEVPAAVTVEVAPSEEPETLLAPIEAPPSPISPPPIQSKIISTESEKLENTALKCFIVGLVLLSLAVVLTPICSPVGIILAVVSSWLLWTSLIMVLNHFAEDSVLEKPIAWLHALTMELNAGLASAGLFPLTLSSEYLEPKGNPKGRPILLINGYLSFASTWHYQRQRLIEAGFGPIYSMNIGSFGSIEDYAKQVQAKTKEIAAQTGRSDLILIGHSKGGLVSSYYATHFADENSVTDVITIGSPLAGTPIARFGPGTDARQMTPGHLFNEELCKAIKSHGRIRFFHIASKTDQVVPLHSALIIEDPSRHRIIRDVGHLGLVFSAKTGDQICSWIRQHNLQT